jgi:drug/metabolite transporter (DMT)-like permease
MQRLNAYEAALFTIFTPLYVSLINDCFRKQFSAFHLAMSLLAVLGAAIIKYSNTSLGDILVGFLLMQVSNICFSFGQIDYKRIRNQNKDLKDSQIYALLFLGGVIITAIVTTFTHSWSSALQINQDQLLTLVFLGAVASGIGFFWWNKGAVTTNAGTLAVMNNLKIPLAVAVSLLVFGERVDIPRLLLGGSVMILAIVLNEWHKPLERKN